MENVLRHIHAHYIHLVYLNWIISLKFYNGKSKKKKSNLSTVVLDISIFIHDALTLNPLFGRELKRTRQRQWQAIQNKKFRHKWGKSRLILYGAHVELHSIYLEFSAEGLRMGLGLLNRFYSRPYIWAANGNNEIVWKRVRAEAVAMASRVSSFLLYVLLLSFSYFSFSFFFI